MSEHERIILVEDDRDQAMLFTQVLAPIGRPVSAVETADDALACVDDAPVALLITDWDLPGMKGDELIATLRTQRPEMKTLLYSNHTHVDTAAAHCGADAWFRKTDGITQLRLLVRRLLESR